VFMCTFLIWLFHFWVPIRTLTVFSMRPADTTTALICRVAAVASFCVDIVVFILLALYTGRGRGRLVEGCGLLSKAYHR